MFKAAHASLGIAIMWAGFGCGHHANKAQESSTASASRESSAQASQNGTKSAETVWPDGFVVASEEEWIPVLDDAGQALHDARAAFQRGDRKQAAQSVRRAIADIERDRAKQAGAERSKYQKLESQLSKLAKRLEGSGEVTLAELDHSLADAYRSDAALDWVYMREEAWTPVFEQPSVHFGQALKLLEQDKKQAAADEIRRGAGYFRVAAASANEDDRDRLSRQVDALSALAKRAEKGELSAQELKQTAAETNNVFAECYLRKAEHSWARNDDPRAGRALEEGVVRTRAASRWTDTEGRISAQTESVEDVAEKLRQGSHVSSHEVRSAFDQLRAQIERERDAAQAMSTQSGR